MSDKLFGIFYQEGNDTYVVGYDDVPGKLINYTPLTLSKFDWSKDTIPLFGLGDHTPYSLYSVSSSNQIVQLAMNPTSGKLYMFSIHTPDAAYPASAELSYEPTKYQDFKSTIILTLGKYRLGVTVKNGMILATPQVDHIPMFSFFTLPTITYWRQINHYEPPPPSPSPPSPPKPENKKGNMVIIILGVLLAVVIIIIAILLLNKKKQ
jgi:hypothetical protein